MVTSFGFLDFLFSRRLVFKHVIWFSLLIFLGLLLLASVALFAALKVVILTLIALPASVWELEVIVSAFTAFLLVSWLGLRNEWLITHRFELL